MKHLETPMRTIYDRDFERYTTHIQVDRANYVLVLSPNEHDSKGRAEEIVTAVNNFDKMKEALEWAVDLVEESHKEFDTLTSRGVENLAKYKQLLESLK